MAHAYLPCPFQNENLVNVVNVPGNPPGNPGNPPVIPRGFRPNRYAPEAACCLYGQFCAPCRTRRISTESLCRR